MGKLENQVCPHCRQFPTACEFNSQLLFQQLKLHFRFTFDTPYRKLSAIGRIKCPCFPDNIGFQKINVPTRNQFDFLLFMILGPGFYNYSKNPYLKLLWLITSLGDLICSSKTW